MRPLRDVSESDVEHDVVEIMEVAGKLHPAVVVLLLLVPMVLQGSITRMVTTTIIIGTFIL
jgi:hypothetical protein